MAEKSPARPTLVRAALAGLSVLLFARLALHVAIVPLFEGPDEPFHLSRVSAVARGRGILGIAPLDPAVQRSIPRHPCGPDLARAFGCPPFPGAAGAGRARAGTPAVHPGYPNYENNQPPLYYAAAGGLLALSEAIFPARPGREPEDELVRLRVLSLLLVAAAVVGPLRRVSRRRSASFALLGFCAMLLPGFSESLVRASNDALLLLWGAFAVELVDRGDRGPVLPALLAAGCLIKLNALPILVFSLVVLWREGRRRLALVSVAAAALPVALLGGSTWGGAVKIAKRIPAPMPAGEVAAGLLRSAYTIVKGVAWVGEWSFFRPPPWLLFAAAALLAIVASRVRFAPRPPRLAAHAAGFAVAVAGSIAFVLADRRVFGAWAGVGGWYVWGWSPWLAVAADDVLEWRHSPRGAIAAAAAGALLFNVCWFASAGRLYGWTATHDGGGPRGEVARDGIRASARVRRDSIDWKARARSSTG